MGALESQGRNEITRNEALAAFKVFVKLGISSPDALDNDSPEVKAAYKVYNDWKKQEEAKVKKIRPAKARKIAEYNFNFLMTNFFVDAGFISPKYLADVRRWITCDLGDLEEQPENPEIERLRKKSLKQIKKITGFIGD